MVLPCLNALTIGTNTKQSLDFLTSNASLKKRLEREYGGWPQSLNVDLLLEQWDNNSDTSKAPIQWRLKLPFEESSVRCEIVIQFPIDYPFKPPYYYVNFKTGDSSTLIELKQFLSQSTKKHTSEYEHIHQLERFEFIGLQNFSPAVTVSGYVEKLMEDPIIMNVLKKAAH